MMVARDQEDPKAITIRVLRPRCNSSSLNTEAASAAAEWTITPVEEDTTTGKGDTRPRGDILRTTEVGLDR